MMTHTLRAAGVAAVTCLLGLAHGALAAAPQPWEMGLQPAASPVKHALDDFHSLLLVIITAITLLVLALLVTVVVRFNATRNPTPSSASHNTLLEVAWTVIPVIILVATAIPAARTLIAMEDTRNSELTVKVVGYQWKWQYDYLGKGVSFYSTLAAESNVARQLN